MSVLRELNEVLSNNLRRQIKDMAGYPDEPRSGGFGGGPRSLLTDDIEAFMEAAESRPIYARRAPRSARARFLRDLAIMYPTRLRRLRKEMAWFRKQAAKHGLNPEDVEGLV